MIAVGRSITKQKTDQEIPEDASINGEIGIHGVPNDKDDLVINKQNWTWNCISLTNKDVNALYTIMHKNMSIEITK